MLGVGQIDSGASWSWSLGRQRVNSTDRSVATANTLLALLSTESRLLEGLVAYGAR